MGSKAAGRDAFSGTISFTYTYAGVVFGQEGVELFLKLYGE